MTKPGVDLSSFTTSKPGKLVRASNWKSFATPTSDGYFTLQTEDTGDVPVRMFLTADLLAATEDNLYGQIVNATRFPGVKIGHWAGLYAPKDTPKAIVDKMNAELLATVKSKEFADKLVPQGIEPAPYSMAAYNAFLTAERDRLGKIARAAKMQPD